MDRFTRLISIIVIGDDARESTQHLVDRLRLTSEATRELSASLDPGDVVQAIVERIAEQVDVDRITVTKFWPDSIEAIAGYDRSRPPARIGARWELTPELRTAIESGEAVVRGLLGRLGNARRYAGTAVGRAQAGDAPAQSRRARARHPRREPSHRIRQFAQLDLENLEQIALSAALALQNASLFAETKEAQQKALRVLLSVSDHLDCSASDADLFARFAGTVAELVGARRVMLWRLSTDRSRC